MRELFGLRFWASLVALVGLVALVSWIVPSDATDDEGAGVVTVERRRVDLVTPVASASAASGFAVRDGVTTTDLTITLDAQRTMVIVAGTKGSVDCALSGNSCVVAADLLGDAVLWFALVSAPSGTNLTLPAVVELLDDGRVALANGWLVPHAPRVERRCDEDTASLTAFIERFGEDATSTFDVESQQVVRVTCQ